MKRLLRLLLMLASVSAPSPAFAAEGSLTMDEAVAVALRKNRDVIAARLKIDEAELDRVAAEVYPNPVLSYSVGNLVLGAGNPYNAASGQAPEHPGVFEQLQHTIGITEVLDIWAKRSARVRAAEHGIEATRLGIEDALRQIVHDVRVAFSDVVREQAEHDLSHEMRDRYAETVRISRSRFEAGEISETELRKVEIEGLRYQDAALDADMQLDLARQNLASLLGLERESDLPASMADPNVAAPAAPMEKLIVRALAERPDLRALKRARTGADAVLARERREALPDVTIGVAYTRSSFLASGDNPNALGLSVSLPLPLFDRNQAGIGRAEVAMRRTDNEIARQELRIQHEVSEAARRAEWARTRVDVYEKGGMLERAAAAQRVAERSYRAGAISLLELLEAERTYLETKGEYLKTKDERQRSVVDLFFALGSEPK